MASKPVRSYGNMSSATRSLINSIESQIEVVIFQYAQEKYGSDFKLERFTELAWNVFRKPSGWFSTTGELLLSVQLPDYHDPSTYPESNGFALSVQFHDVLFEDLLSFERAKKCCMELSRRTGLTVRALEGGWFFGNPH